MRIHRARFENFTVFDQADFEFSPGINILIGKNGTGKSHVLRALYGLTEGIFRVFSEEEPSSLSRQVIKSVNPNPKKELNAHQEKIVKIYFTLSTVFSHQFGKQEQHLRARQRNQSQSKVSAEAGENMKFSIVVNDAEISISCPADGAVIGSTPDKMSIKGSPLLIPSREVLSVYPGFVALYIKRQLSFDSTYFELCQALSLPELREVPALLADLARPLEAALGGRVILKDEHFVIQRESGEMDINMEAEGLRKFAMLLRLIANGSLEPGSILCWDEPEGNMNPALVVIMKDFLVGLAKAGIQVFLATHDYLLCSELSLEAEYGNNADLVKFFCLSKDSHVAPVSIESGPTMADLKHNPIVEEFEAHYQREAHLFAGSRDQK